MISPKSCNSTHRLEARQVRAHYSGLGRTSMHWPVLSYALLETKWGTAAIIGRGHRLIGLFLPDEPVRLRRRVVVSWPSAIESPQLLMDFQVQLKDYFCGKRVRFHVDVDLCDLPEFRLSVLNACRRIPHGQTASYQDLARAVGNPAASRAVGSAMANNPIPLVIPCHRVLRADGSIGGFSSPAGVAEKLRLLELEGVSTAQLGGSLGAGFRHESRYDLAAG